MLCARRPNSSDPVVKESVEFLMAHLQTKGADGEDLFECIPDNIARSVKASGEPLYSLDTHL